jgi:hypothetical protein
METSEVLNTVPTEMTAGTTQEWSMSLAHTPADGYTATINIANADGDDLSKAAVASDDNQSFDFTLTPTDTDAFATGVYFYQVVTSKSGEKHLETSGQISMHALIGNAAYDGRSFAKKIIDAIDALVLNRATIDQQSYQIGNRQLSRIPLIELRQIRKDYAEIYGQEVRKARIEAGKSLWPSIKVKFS